MAAEDDLWTAVRARYSDQELRPLTNVRQPNATVVDDAAGTAAALTTIRMFGIYAETDYDEANPIHLEVATFGVIAILFQRGGVAPNVAEIEFGEVFGPDGMIQRIRRTDPRAHGLASKSGNARRSPESRDGRAVMPWSDRERIPEGIVPRPRRQRF